MINTTLSSIVSASRDIDLQERLAAAAARLNVPGDPYQWVLLNINKLAAAQVSEDGATIASVYDYAASTYVPAPRPGQNPAAVTDTLLMSAVTSVLESISNV